MADSKLLKEAIADAKAVRETAIQNARIALEEAFTPKLQAVLSKKLQSEMEEEDYDMDYEDEDEMEENVDSSKVGKGDGSAESGTDSKQPSGTTNSPHTDLDPETDHNASAVGHEDDNTDKVKDLEETDSAHELPDPYRAEKEEPEEEMETGVYEEEDYEDEDDMDLESVIKELEAELDDEEEEYDVDVDADVDADYDMEDDEEVEFELDEEEFEMDGEDDEVSMDLDDDEFDDELDLDEILREMGYGEDDEDMDEMKHDEDEEKYEELESQLEAAYDTIKSLRGTINEVNLLNAKLLFTNKIFRGYELDNSQKAKVIESLDRTNSVREVKLVYATLAESMKFGGKVNKKKVKSITEGMASRPAQSTAPKKEIISESNELANRFKKLAGI